MAQQFVEDLEDRVRDFRCKCKSLLSILPPLLVKTLEKSWKTLNRFGCMKAEGTWRGLQQSDLELWRQSREGHEACTHAITQARHVPEA